MSQAMGGSSQGRASGLARLFSGRTAISFVGRQRTWFTVTAVVVVVAVGAIALRGLAFGIDFTGGTSFVVGDITQEVTAEEIRSTVAEVGASEVDVQLVDGGRGVRVSTPDLSDVAGTEQRAVADALDDVTGVERSQVDTTAIGPQWGERITGAALRALAVFAVLVVCYIILRFEWRMAVSALAALAHDLLATAGVYALFGLTVSPASVIAVLTILGYSLYDTVVIFDRIAEDTADLTSTSRQTYSEVANRSLNGVVLRSVSTSITSLLPVVSLLVIGVGALGAATLVDVGVALAVGMAVGTYSSLFVAGPLLVMLKEREPQYARMRRRLEESRA